MIDTTPKRLRELARDMRPSCGPLLENVRITLLALASEKEAQNHSEQHLEMVADVPLPEPVAWASGLDLITAKLGRDRYGAHGACELHAMREGGPAGRHDSALFALDQMRQYGQACAKAARDAAFDECVRVCEKVSDQLGDGTGFETDAEKEASDGQKIAAWMHYKGDFCDPSLQKLERYAMGLGWTQKPLYLCPPYSQTAKKGST